MPVAPYHTAVLLREVLHYLLNDPEGVYVDATLGGGGHSEAILRQLHPAGRLIGIDTDREALEVAAGRLHGFEGRFTAVGGNFRDLALILKGQHLAGIDGALFDLGVSSHQIDEPDRGFSFQQEGPLDMRMDASLPVSAADIVNTYDVALLAKIFEHYGEERHALRIARAIDRRRREEPFVNTAQLREAVSRVAVGHPLTKTLARIFQALRIEVNGELNALQAGLEQAVDVLHSGGTLVVISYHSLEDRIVKSFMAERSRRVRPMVHPLAPPEMLEPMLELLTKKPVVPGRDELAANTRARSAKLRAARRTERSATRQ